METHVSALLQAWPSPIDSFVLFTNKSNVGLSKVIDEVPKDIISKVVVIKDSETLTISVKLIIERLALPLAFLFWQSQCRKLLRRHGPFDLLIVENGGYPGSWRSLAAVLAAKKLKLERRLLVVHHCAASRLTFRVVAERLLDRIIEKSITDLVAISDATHKSLVDTRGFDIEKVSTSVIHNGIIFEKNIVEDKSIRIKVKIQPNQLLIGILGRVQPYKGYEDLLVGVSGLGSEYRKRVVVVFVGLVNSDESNRLLQIARRLKIDGQVHVIGFVSLHSAQIVRQFDLLVSATKSFEAFGLTIAEAMSQHVPVLVTRVGGVVELVDENTGFVVSPESPTEIANAIRRFIDDPQYVDDMKSRAYLRVQEFSAAKMATKFHHLVTSGGTK